MDKETKTIYKKIVYHLQSAKTINRKHFEMEWGNSILDEELTAMIERLEEQMNEKEDE